MTTVISGDTGVSQVQAGSINQDDLAANVVGKGPAFSVYRSTNIAATLSTRAKLPLNAKDFDTTNAFDTTNYRFQPTVAGYYQINVGLSTTGSTSLSIILCSIAKNGAEVGASATQTAIDISVSVSTTVYLNGTTDYVEALYQINAASSTISGTKNTLMSGFLARAA